MTGNFRQSLQGAGGTEQTATYPEQRKTETTEDVRRLCTTELAPGQNGGPVADKTDPRGQVPAGLRNLVAGRAMSLQPAPP